MKVVYGWLEGGVWVVDAWFSFVGCGAGFTGFIGGTGGAGVFSPGCILLVGPALGVGTPLGLGCDGDTGLETTGFCTAAPLTTPGLAGSAGALPSSAISASSYMWAIPDATINSINVSTISEIIPVIDISPLLIVVELDVFTG